MSEKVKPKCDALGCGNDATTTRKTSSGTLHFCQECANYFDATREGEEL